MLIRSAEELRLARAALASGNPDALDRLTATGVFAPDLALREAARAVVLDEVRAVGLYPASIHALYLARGRGDAPHDFTVPAVNLRGMVYDSARALFRARKALDAGAVICEIARSEITYTDQRPGEFAFVVLAAALREGWRGPVFLQGDHFQINAGKYATDPAGELEAVHRLIAEGLAAGFYNIDIDTSTLVDLGAAGHSAQQQRNGELCAALLAYVRALEPAGVTVSVGGEIGEVGGRNSTAEEMVSFMEVFARALASSAPNAPGLSKISIQTGTSHGGVPLPDGSVAPVQLDFETLGALSRIARERYGLAGAVQHGASTLPAALFDRFPAHEACEIHLATEFQNLLFDHPAFPGILRDAMHARLRVEAAGERKAGDTEEQFLYKTRKRALGTFKRELWSLPLPIRQAIGATLEDKFRTLFTQLRVTGTRALAERWSPPVPGAFPGVGSLAAAAHAPEDITGLHD